MHEVWDLMIGKCGQILKEYNGRLGTVVGRDVIKRRLK